MSGAFYLVLFACPHALLDTGKMITMEIQQALYALHVLPVAWLVVAQLLIANHVIKEKITTSKHPHLLVNSVMCLIALSLMESFVYTLKSMKERTGFLCEEMLKWIGGILLRTMLLVVKAMEMLLKIHKVIKPLVSDMMQCLGLKSCLLGVILVKG